MRKKCQKRKNKKIKEKREIQKVNRERNKKESQNLNSQKEQYQCLGTKTFIRIEKPNKETIEAMKEIKEKSNLKKI